MASEKTYHTDKEKDMIKDKKKTRDEYNKTEFENQGDIETAEKEADSEKTDL
jgi:hypothetical protein